MHSTNKRNLNIALAAWLTCYTALTWASTSMAQDVVAYDWLSLLMALGAGLLGGAGRTLYTMLSEGFLVGNVKALLVKDLGVSVIGGGVAYLLIQGWNEAASAITLVTLPHVLRDLRILIIVGAGFSRGRWYGAVDRLASDALARASARVRDGAPPIPEPAAVAAPPVDAPINPT